ncbi:MAG: molecular chaperone TorD family protein, partial [Proteobacteria bacterium]|nr:molecular chaperone TorD family protein [Pseudomonadota bacterium]
ASVDPEAAGDEFQALFVGVGKSEVSLYASHYLGPQSGRPLAAIRATLASLGLARRPGSSEFEDHFSVELETMRMLVAGDTARRPATIAEQRAFCETHLLPWAFDLCAAISTSFLAKYYRQVASFTGCFLALERDSFAIE